MKIIIMGAGVIGVTSAYFLAKSGHQVVVIEKNCDAALGCSYANGGQLSFSHIESYSSKNSKSLNFKALFQPNSFLLLKNFSKDFAKFLLEFVKNCSEKKSKKISEKIFLLSQESRKNFEYIINEDKIDCSYKNEGILHFYRNKKLFENAIKEAEFQISLGDEIEILNADECVKKEPTLHKILDNKKLVGGIFYKNNASADTHLFTQKLAKICQEKYGVIFEYENEIKNIFTNHKKITGIHTNKNVYAGDAYIYALGSYGNKLLSGIKINSRIFGVKGYSLSIDTDQEFLAPKLSLTDVENKIVYSRIGDVFRAAGAVEISNISNSKINKKLINLLKSKIVNSFSDFGNLSKAKEWQGFRPFRPNSIPLVLKCEKYGNLLLNSGHGHLGFTLSCGCAKIISDIISNKNDDKFSFLKEEIL